MPFPLLNFRVIVTNLPCRGRPRPVQFESLSKQVALFYLCLLTLRRTCSLKVPAGLETSEIRTSVILPVFTVKFTLISLNSFWQVQHD